LLTQTEGNKHRLFKTTRRVIYWTLPLLILYLVFSRIDFERLKQIVLNANSLPILLGIVLIALTVWSGGLRWHFLLHRYDFTSGSVFKSVGDYWKSLAIGVLAPGSLGSDAYRVMILGRQSGRYLGGAFIIGVEKLAALFSCAFLIAILYPMLSPNHLPGFVVKIVDMLYAFFIFGGAFGIFLILVRQQDWIQNMAKVFNAKLETLAHRVASMSSIPPAQEQMSPSTGKLAYLLSAISPSVALPAVGLSLLVLLISAIQSQLFFYGLGYELPFLVNLFLTPLLVLLFTLPISFGGFGIREGAYILLYGAFGVPVETALVVSFCSLLSMLLSYAIGAFLFLLEKHRRRSHDVLAKTLPSEKVMK